MCATREPGVVLQWLGEAGKLEMQLKLKSANLLVLAMAVLIGANSNVN